MLRHATVVCLSSIDWRFNWQVPQEVAVGLAARGHRVLFVETTGVRAPRPRDLPRAVSRLRNWRASGGAPRPVAPGVDVLAPMVLPLPYSRLACWLNTRLLARQVRRWMNGVRQPGPLVLLTYVPTPLAHGLREELDPALTVYYCADRLSSSSGAARALVPHEERLFASADLVLVTSSRLQRDALAFTDRVRLLSSGVRFSEFERGRVGRRSLPSRLHGLRRPMVGIVGSLRTELDLALLERVVALAPDISFVLVGPVHADVRALARCPNVVLVGAVPHDEAVRYILSLDAGLLPYAMSPYTEGLMPVKLKEYLAAGIPVVATAIPELQHFDQLHPGLIRFAGDEQEFVAALRAALEHTDPSAIDRRVDVARQYDWSVQMEALQASLDVAMMQVHRRAGRAATT